MFRRPVMVIGGGSAKRTNAGSSKRAAEPNASLAKIARRYGIARRVLCRWKQELAPPVFIAVQVTDADASPRATTITEEAVP